MEDMMNTTEEMMDTVENEETAMVPCDSTTCEDDESSVSLGGLAIGGLALIGAGMLIKKGIEVGKKAYGRYQAKKAKEKEALDNTVEFAEVEVAEVETVEPEKENLKK